jgi:hydrogenase-4 membrane subunit HyfE
MRDAIPAVIALIVLEGIVAVADLDAGSNGWHLAIALSPLLAGLWLVWVQVRTLRRCDEYQRSVQLEAMSVGFGVAMLVAMTGGLLDGADVGSSSQYLQLTFISGILSWVGALAIRARH